MRAERQRLLSLIDGIPALLYLQSPDYSVRLANRQFRERFGEPEDLRFSILDFGLQVGGENPKSSEIGEQVNNLKYKIQNLQSDRPQTWEWLDAKTGRTYHIYDSPFYNIDGTLLVLEMGIDSSDCKRAEQDRDGFFTLSLDRKSYIEFVHPDDRKATIAEAQKLATGLETLYFENRCRCKDGSYRWLA